MKAWFQKVFFTKHLQKRFGHIEPDKEMQRNIYGVKTWGEYIKKNQFIYGLTKYGFIVPMVKLFTWFSKKHFSEKIEERYEYRFLNAFEKAVDNGHVIWVDKFLYGHNSGFKPAVFVKRWMQSLAAKTIINGKNILLHSARGDSAYFELFNSIMIQLKNELNKLDTEGYISYHVKTGIDDPVYFIANIYKNEVTISERARQTKHWYNEEGELIVKDIGGWKQLAKNVANELNTTPNKIWNEVIKLKAENKYLFESLAGFNNSSANVLLEVTKDNQVGLKLR